MRRLLIVTTLGLVMLGGCFSSNNQKWPTSVNDPVYPVFVQQAESEIKTFTTISVGSYLLVNNDPKDRAKSAKFAYEVATSVSQAASDNKLSLDDLRQYATNLIVKNSNENDKQLVGNLMNVISLYIESKMNNELAVSLDSNEVHQETARRLIKAAADAVADATRPYAGKPTTEPAKAKELRLPE